ncbi:CD99 antigen [Rhineura floridana]|uniref:CD99 antigen n=1 Tax=Rhineura floridana TaxID=261503 RepID=UPI002AC88062|nr:CD99 antigen [Rhineura floridana]
MRGGGTMRGLALLAPFVLLLLAAHCRGQDLSLEDALADLAPTQKPVTPKKKPTQDDDLGFDLEDAINDPSNPAPAAPPQPVPPQPKPGSHDNSGGFSDSDLFDGQLPADKSEEGGRRDSGSNENTEGSQGMLAGIISSVVVAIAGAVSSFIAYQKKKLCFKASDQENVNMESQQGAYAEPPVQRTLLQKQ